MPRTSSTNVEEIRAHLGRRSGLLRFAQWMKENDFPSQERGLIRQANVEWTKAQKIAQKHPEVVSSLQPYEQEALVQGSLLPPKWNCPELRSKYADLWTTCRQRQQQDYQTTSSLQNNHEVESYKTEIQQLHNQNTELIASITNLENQLQSQLQSHTEVQKQIQEYITSLEIERKQLLTSQLQNQTVFQNELKEIETDKQQLLDQLQKSMNVQQQLEETITQLQTQMQMKLQNNNDSNSAVQIQSEQLQELQKENTDLQKQVGEHFEENKRLHDELIQLEEQSTILRQENADLQKKQIVQSADVSAVVSSCQQTNRRLEKCSQVREEQHNQIEQLRNDLASCNTRAEKAETGLQSLQNIQLQMKNTITLCDIRIAELQEQLSISETKSNDLLQSLAQGNLRRSADEKAQINLTNRNEELQIQLVRVERELKKQEQLQTSLKDEMDQLRRGRKTCSDALEPALYVILNILNIVFDGNREKIGDFLTKYDFGPDIDKFKAYIDSI